REVHAVGADCPCGSPRQYSRSPPYIKPPTRRYSFVGWQSLAVWSEMPPKQPNRPDRRPGQSDRRQPNRRQPDRRQSEGNRSRDGDDRQPRRGSIAAVPTGDLPRWVRDEITRTAPKARREPAITHLTKAVSEFADERYGAAYTHLRSAKDLAPQAATIRELLG